MIIDPIFDQNPNRPFRWALKIVTTGEFLEYTFFPDDRYVHWTTKTTPALRDVTNEYSPMYSSEFIPMRRKNIGFLTTHHRDFYEDGKYTEVWNDPINYILTEDATYTTAYNTAEARIGNYRVGTRRHIIHLGGTISEDELDLLEDSEGVALTSLPLFPPLPPADFLKPFRSHLITSDVGYIDYIKAAHSDETTTARYAYQSKQSTGFRQFIFDAGNTNMKYESAVINSVSKVDVQDIETITNAAINTATDADATTFLPIDGEWSIYNIASNNVIRTDPISGLSLEKWNGTSTLGTTLQAYINITPDAYINIVDVNTNSLVLDNTGIIITDGVNTNTFTSSSTHIQITDGTRIITLSGSGLVLTDGTRTITMNGSTVDVT